MPIDARLPGWTAGLGKRVAQALRRVTGMPDYAGYLTHMAERHPECPVISEREFFEEYVQARYGSGVSRCC
ncbi:MAG TPA: YbdD/YjiX family protein [Gemmatimonadales bacterium]